MVYGLSYFLSQFWTDSLQEPTEHLISYFLTSVSQSGKTGRAQHLETDMTEEVWVNEY